MAVPLSEPQHTVGFIFHQGKQATVGITAETSHVSRLSSPVSLLMVYKTTSNHLLSKRNEKYIIMISSCFVDVRT